MGSWIKRYAIIHTPARRCDQVGRAAARRTSRLGSAAVPRSGQGLAAGRERRPERVSEEPW
jgi:hypothetical protein